MIISHSTTQNTAARGYFAHDCIKCASTRPFLSLNLTTQEHVRIGLVAMTVGDDGLGRDLAICDFCGFQIRFKARVVTEAVDWDGDIGAIMHDTKSQLERKDAAPDLALAVAHVHKRITAARRSLLSLKDMMVMQPLVAFFVSLAEIAIYALIAHRTIPPAALLWVFLANLAAFYLYKRFRWKRTLKELLRERIDRLTRFYKVPLMDVQRAFQDVERYREEPAAPDTAIADQRKPIRRRR